MPSSEVNTNYLVIACPKSHNDRSYTYPVLRMGYLWRFHIYDSKIHFTIRKYQWMKSISNKKLHLNDSSRLEGSLLFIETYNKRYVL